MQECYEGVVSYLSDAVESLSSVHEFAKSTAQTRSDTIAMNASLQQEMSEFDVSNLEVDPDALAFFNMDSDVSKYVTTAQIEADPAIVVSVSCNVCNVTGASLRNYLLRRMCDAVPL